jgi:hypothetical protein
MPATSTSSPAAIFRNDSSLVSPRWAASTTSFLPSGIAVYLRKERDVIQHFYVCFYSGQYLRLGYVQMNMKARLFYLWARIFRKLTGKPEQLELNLWTRRSTR